MRKEKKKNRIRIFARNWDFQFRLNSRGIKWDTWKYHQPPFNLAITFIIIGGRGGRRIEVRAHSFQFYSARSHLPPPLPAPFHFTGERRKGRKNSEDGMGRVSSFPGLKARPFELGFSTGISASRSTIPEMHTNATALCV